MFNFSVFHSGCFSDYFFSVFVLHIYIAFAFLGDLLQGIAGNLKTLYNYHDF
jgi:hypothetical protein